MVSSACVCGYKCSTLVDEDEKLTEKQFIGLFKKNGFDIYGKLIKCI